MLSFIKDFEKQVEKMDGVASNSEPPRYWFHTGNYAMNYVLSGNCRFAIPQGRVIGLAGPSSSGKSFVQCNITREAQKGYVTPDGVIHNAPGDGAYVLMIDSENSLDDDFVSKIGVNVDKSVYNYKSVVTISNTIKLISAFISGYKKTYGTDPSAPKVLIVIDSLDMLLTETELSHFESGNNAGDQGQRAKQLKSMLKNFVQQIKDLNVSIIITHQVYSATQDQLLKGEGVWVINNAVRYSLSLIALLTRLKLKDGTDVTGIRMKVSGFKTRFTKPFQDVVIDVPYEDGMDPLSGLCEIFEAVGILQAAGAYKKIVGTETKFYRRDMGKYLDILFEKFDSLQDKHINIGANEEEVIPLETEAALKEKRHNASRIEAAQKELSE